jgi:hypothetical protein
MVKGTSLDVDPNKPLCHIKTADRGMVEVRMAELKALYFVKSLLGDPTYHEAHDLDPADLRQRGAAPVEIRFKDGERLVGFTVRYPPNRPFFFVSPADKGSNNIRILVNQAAIVSSKALQDDGAGTTYAG